jgi:basic amino acid/polyamine antiporter, APA family
VRTPLHPWSTLLFIAAAGYVVLGSIGSNPGNALRGAGLLALGLPVYAYWKSRSRVVFDGSAPPESRKSE